MMAGLATGDATGLATGLAWGVAGSGVGSGVATSAPVCCQSDHVCMDCHILCGWNPAMSGRSRTNCLGNPSHRANGSSFVAR